MAKRKVEFTQDEVVEMLEARIGNQPQKEFAVELGISASFLSNVLRKARLPDGSILKALDLEPVEQMYRRVR